MIQPITNHEINQSKVASLPTRPNASSTFGGAGYTSAQLKAAFDRLPLLLAERYNALVNAISEAGEEGIAGKIPSGITDPNGNVYSLFDLLSHIQSGEFATYLKVGSSYLDLVLSSLAPLDSPDFSGTPTAVTPALSDESGRVATTAWVKQVCGTMTEVFEAVQQGLYGHMPEGGEAGEVLVKTSNVNHHTEWTNLKSYAFENATANTQPPTDSSKKLATTAFVKTIVDNAVAALKGGAEEAYDTLLELAEAIEANDSDIAEALQTIAEKDNKTLFVSFSDGDTLTLSSSTEYRAEGEVANLSLVLPQTPADDFMVSLAFSTVNTADMTYSYTGTLYCTGDDCTEGVFFPIRHAHYTVVIWYSGEKYQGVVRRSL